MLGNKAEEYKQIYNRYAHINLEISDKTTNVELLYADHISIKLNYNDLSKINVKYILSKEEFSQDSFFDNFEKIYNEDGMCIYKVMEGIE